VKGGVVDPQNRREAGEVGGRMRWRMGKRGIQTHSGREGGGGGSWGEEKGKGEGGGNGGGEKSY